LGVFVLLIAISNIARAGAVRIVRPAWAYLAGVGGGVTSTLFGAGGPPYAIYLSRRDLSKEQYRSTLAVCTMFSISSRVVAFMLAGLLLTPKPWLWALAVLPASLAGLWAASRLFSRVSREGLIRAGGDARGDMDLCWCAPWARGAAGSGPGASQPRSTAQRDNSSAQSVYPYGGIELVGRAGHLVI
jgi:hypothetical protein